MFTPSPHPNDITNYNQGYFNGAGQLMSMLSMYLQQTQGIQATYPGSFNVPYGGSIQEAYLAREIQERTRGAYAYSLGSDRVAQGQNLATIVSRTLASFGVDVSQEMFQTIQKAADTLSTWGPQALSVAEQLIGQSAGGDNQLASTIVGTLSKALDATYGPTGATLPFFLQARHQAQDVIPLGMQNSFLQSYMHELFAIDQGTSRTGGYTASDLSRILQYSVQQGGNPFAYADTDIARSEALSLIGREDLSKEQYSDLARERMNITVRPIQEKSTIEHALGLWTQSGGADRTTRFQAVEGLKKGFELQSQIRQLSLQVKDNKELKESLRAFSAENAKAEDWDILSARMLEHAKTVADKKQRRQIEQLARNMGTQANNMSKYGFNPSSILKEAQAKQKQEIEAKVRESNLFTKDEDIKNYTEGLILKDQLRTFGLNEDLLTANAYDKEGNIITDASGKPIAVWQNMLKEGQLNDQAAAVVQKYFGSGIYTRQKELETQVEKQLTSEDQDTLKQFREASPEEQKVMLQDPNVKRIVNFVTAQKLAGQSGQTTTNLGEATSQMGIALQATGSQIQDPAEQARFLDMITQGGFTSMSDTRLRNVASQISAGMIAGRATDQQVAQMSMAGHKAALAAGANTKTGGVSGVLMGLAATRVARTHGHMNVEVAQQLAAEAGGSANRSIVTQAINSISAKLQNVDVDSLPDDNPNKELFRKIKNKEILTQEELNRLETSSTDIMSSLGMSSREIHNYMHSEYSGEDNDYAVAHGTAQLLNSRIVQQVTQAGAQNVLEDSDVFKRLEAGDQQSLVSSIADSLGSVDKEILTDSTKAEEYKKALVKRLRDTKQDDLANQVESMDAMLLQKSANRAMRGGADTITKGDTDQFITMLQLNKGILNAYAQNKASSVISDAMPKLNKSMGGSVVQALKEGNLAQVFTAMTTAFSDVSMTDEQKDTAFRLLGIQSIIDDRFKEATGLSPDKTNELRGYLSKLYGAAGGDAKGMEMINELVTSGKSFKDLSDDEKALVARSGLKEETFDELSATLMSINSSIREQYEGATSTSLNKDAGSYEDEEEAVPPVQEDNKTPVSGTTTPSTTSKGTPKASKEDKEGDKPGEEGADPKGADSKPTVASTKADGSWEHPFIVQFKPV